jgi:hypothetical protein
MARGFDLLRTVAHDEDEEYVCAIVLRLLIYWRRPGMDLHAARDAS